MVIVRMVTSSQTASENIETSELKPYQSNNIQDPYITAYLEAKVTPLTFLIGDGKEYNSKTEKYFNQPLKQNSNYVVLLRYFESQVKILKYFKIVVATSMCKNEKPSKQLINFLP